MNRLLGVMAIVAVVLLAMGFAAGNAGNRVTLELGLFTLYRIPVTLVAFGGLFVGMVVMFATGIHSDLKVRRILRERLVEESRQEQGWIDRDQRDLFGLNPGGEEDDEEDEVETPGWAVGDGVDDEGVSGLAVEDTADEEMDAPVDDPDLRYGE